MLKKIHMKIRDEWFDEIIVMDADGGVLAVISDNEIIEHDDVKVVCVPVKGEQNGEK